MPKTGKIRANRYVDGNFAWQGSIVLTSSSWKRRVQIIFLQSSLLQLNKALQQNLTCFLSFFDLFDFYSANLLLFTCLKLFPQNLCTAASPLIIKPINCHPPTSNTKQRIILSTIRRAAITRITSSGSFCLGFRLGSSRLGMACGSQAEDQWIQFYIPF